MFITFEGMEGAGKGTVIASVIARLTALGVAFVQTREPGGSDLGAPIRALLLDARRDIAPKAELFLYLADRAQHVEKVVRPALNRGLLVLSDRYADSTIVYQGYGRGLDVGELFRLNEIAVSGLWPDLSIILDLPPEMGLERALRRNAEQGLSVREGRFEAEALAFHTAVRQGYLDWAGKNPDRFRVVDAALSPEKVLHAVWNLLSERLQLPSPANT